MSRLFSIGELIIDFQSVGIGTLKDTKQFVKNAGGAPANVCAQVVKFNQKATYLSKVGDDGFGEFLIESLKNEGIDTTHISKSQKYDTSLAFVSFKEDGEREFSFYRKNAADLYFEVKDFENVSFNKDDILEFGSVALKTMQARSVHDYLIKKAKESGALVAFDPNLRFNLWEDLKELKDVVNQYLKYADIVKISDEELEFITSLKEKEAVKLMFKNNNIRILLVTYGSKGARLYLNENTCIYNKGYKVNSIDTTGAGDSFFGAFLAQVLENGINNCNFDELLDMSCKCGAYTTTGYGAIAAMGNKKQVNEVIHNG